MKPAQHPADSAFLVRARKALQTPTKIIGGAALSLALLAPLAPPVMAESSQVIGSIAGSGLVFKDTLQIESFKDPKIPGVSLYISNFQKPLTERLASGKDFFTDPSYASVGCAKTVKGKISVGDIINKTPSGEEVFEEVSESSRREPSEKPFLCTRCVRLTRTTTRPLLTPPPVQIPPFQDPSGAARLRRGHKHGGLRLFQHPPG